MIGLVPRGAAAIRANVESTEPEAPTGASSFEVNRQRLFLLAQRRLGPEALVMRAALH